MESNVGGKTEAMLAGLDVLQRLQRTATLTYIYIYFVQSTLASKLIGQEPHVPSVRVGRCQRS
jgi:hypothetical protein